MQNQIAKKNCYSFFQCKRKSRNGLLAPGFCIKLLEIYYDLKRHVRFMGMTSRHGIDVYYL